MSFECVAGPRLRTEKALGVGPKWDDVQAWGGASALDLQGRGKAARGKEGLWSVEFWSLEVGPWVRVCGWGLGPAHWMGVPSVEVGPWVGV